MGKGPGKSPSNKIINLDKKEMALCKQNGKGTCPKDNLECKFFSNPDTFAFQTARSLWGVDEHIKIMVLSPAI